MNLKPLMKPIFASMLAVGLVSPAIALADDVQGQVDAMRAKIAKMEKVIEQNQGGYYQHPSDWFSRITLSGMINVDGLLSNHAVTTYKYNSDSAVTDIKVANATFFIDGLVSDWTRVHAALNYSDDVSNYRYAPRNLPNTSNGALGLDDSDNRLDEAYVTIGNFARSPFYFRAGRQYVDFGTYDRFPVVESMTQLLTETRATAATVGFLHPMGLNASAYLFRGLDKSTDQYNETKVRNFGAKLGYANTTDNLGVNSDYNLSVSYLHNMADVNYLSRAIVDYNIGNDYASRVPGVSVDLNFKPGPFDVYGHYVTALKAFSSVDVPFQNGYTQDASGNETSTPTYDGAKPAAWSVGAGYSFLTMCHNSHLGLRYDGTREAGGQAGPAFNSAGNEFMGLPQSRFVADYSVNMSRWTDVTLAVFHDRDYGHNQGGTHDNNTTGVLRLGVKFA